MLAQMLNNSDNRKLLERACLDAALRAVNQARDLILTEFNTTESSKVLVDFVSIPLSECQDYLKLREMLGRGGRLCDWIPPPSPFDLMKVPELPHPAQPVRASD